ncbi:helix-turn-helix domain-containing protein [Sphingobium sp. WCS2017Hpa-17]|uniref:helix-turn-helix domain-containing protein n=1 Tax=Sphingobium sp. WCS2017Hpa-17 TaxID=3073638 RepID=UPI00288B85AA|nr:helix-turn-helix domain-containing protein [Sphingobium sp. WCS2017Hpa-17]
MDSQIPAMLSILKSELRAQGIRYADIAQQLRTSEITVKRYLSGKGLTLERLEEICRIAGLELTELHEMLFRHSESRARQLSDEQEMVLLGDLSAAFSFYLLRCGWQPSDIIKEFGLKDHQMFLILRTLERAGLIELMPRERIRLLTTRAVEWQPSGPLRRANDRAMMAAVAAEVANPNAAHREIETVRLSERSQQKVVQMIDHLMRETRALATADLQARHDEDKWMFVLAIAQQTDPGIYFE